MSNRWKAALLLVVSTMLSGCDTEDELLKQRLEMLRAEEAAMLDLETQMSTPTSFEGPGAVNVFLSKDVLNSILAGADGMTIPVPGVADATITLKSMRTDFKLGLPLVNVQATARKKGIDGEFELVGVARLDPTIEEGTPSKLALRIHVDKIVPRARWGFFDVRIGGFIRDLLQVKLTDQMRTVGVIRIPIEQDIPLSIPAKVTPVSFTGAHSNITTPNLSLQAKAGISRLISLPDGLHVYGKLTAKSGAL